MVESGLQHLELESGGSRRRKQKSGWAVICSTSNDPDAVKKRTQFWGRWCGPIWIYFVMLLISMVVLALCAARLDEPKRSILMPLYIIFTITAAICLYLVNCVDPGTVRRYNLAPNTDHQRSCDTNVLIEDENLEIYLEDPESELLLSSDAENRADLQQKLNPGNLDRKEFLYEGARVEFKWCRTCLLWRPPRSSHCRICDRCFLRFDHHCPVVGNCIAKNNHRFFSAFLMIVSLAWLIGAICAILRLHQIYSSDAAHHWDTYLLFFFILISLCYIPALFFFGCFHGFNVICDATTRERIKRIDHQRNLSKNFGEICCGPVVPRSETCP